MSRVRIEPTIAASERPKTHALDRATSGIGRHGNTAFKRPVFIESVTNILKSSPITFHQTLSQSAHPSYSYTPRRNTGNEQMSSVAVCNKAGLPSATEHCSSWQGNTSWPFQKTVCILCTLTAHCRVRKIPPLVFILGEKNPVYSHQIYLTSILILCYSVLSLGLPNWHSSFRFPDQNFVRGSLLVHAFYMLHSSGTYCYPPSMTDIRSTQQSSEEVLWLLVLSWRQTQKQRPKLCAVLTEIRRFSKWNVSDASRNILTCRMSTVQKISCRRQWPVETPALRTATNRQRDRERWEFLNIFWFIYEKMLPRDGVCLCERSA
jgi:hypothetical protein